MSTENQGYQTSSSTEGDSPAKNMAAAKNRQRSPSLLNDNFVNSSGVSITHVFWHFLASPACIYFPVACIYFPVFWRFLDLVSHFCPFLIPVLLPISFKLWRDYLTLGTLNDIIKSKLKLPHLVRCCVLLFSFSRRRPYILIGNPPGPAWVSVSEVYLPTPLWQMFTSISTTNRAVMVPRRLLFIRRVHKTSPPLWLRSWCNVFLHTPSS